MAKDDEKVGTEEESNGETDAEPVEQDPEAEVVDEPVAPEAEEVTPDVVPGEDNT